MNEGGDIYKLIPEIALEIGPVGKESQNRAQGYSFRGIDAIMNASHGPMMRRGVFTTTEVSNIIQQERESTQNKALYYTSLTMKVTFHAPDGSSVSTTTAGEAMDTADKSSNKAMSAAFKYALFQTFMIPTSGEDADTHTHEAKPRTQTSQSPVEKLRSDNERDSFNAWIVPYIESGGITGDEVRRIVTVCKSDYRLAKERCTQYMQPKD